MAALTQADVTVTQDHNDEDYSGQRYNRMYPTVDFGDASLTYDTYGIPLPDLSKFRLKFEIKRVHIQNPSGAYFWIYDPTVRAANPIAPYGTLRAYNLNDGAEMSGAVSATSLPLEIVGA